MKYLLFPSQLLFACAIVVIGCNTSSLNDTEKTLVVNSVDSSTLVATDASNPFVDELWNHVYTEGYDPDNGNFGPHILFTVAKDVEFEGVIRAKGSNTDCGQLPDGDFYFNIESIDLTKLQKLVNIKYNDIKFRSGIIKYSESYGGNKDPWTSIRNQNYLHCEIICEHSVTDKNREIITEKCMGCLHVSDPDNLMRRGKGVVVRGRLVIDQDKLEIHPVSYFGPPPLRPRN